MPPHVPIYGTNRGQIFAGPFSPSTLRRSVISKMATLHVLPRPNRPTTNLTGGLPLPKKKRKKKKKEKAQTLNSAGPPSASLRNNSSHPFHQSHQGKISQEASVHLRKCLSLAGLDMTIKHRRGRNFGLSCLTLFVLSLPTNPLKRMCQVSSIFRDKIQDLKLISPFEEIQHFDGKRKKKQNKTTEQASTGSRAPMLSDTSSES